MGCALAGAANPTAKANRATVFIKEILPFARPQTAAQLAQFPRRPSLSTARCRFPVFLCAGRPLYKSANAKLIAALKLSPMIAAERAARVISSL
jgi:hypothetical protein